MKTIISIVLIIALASASTDWTQDPICQASTATTDCQNEYCVEVISALGDNCIHLGKNQQCYNYIGTFSANTDNTQSTVTSDCTLTAQTQTCLDDGSGALTRTDPIVTYETRHFDNNQPKPNWANDKEYADWNREFFYKSSKPDENFCVNGDPSDTDAFNQANEPFPNWDYKNQCKGPQSGNTSKPDKQVAGKITIAFTENEAMDYTFSFSLDFGWGVAIWVDNVLYQVDKSDIWAGYNWNVNNGDHFQLGPQPDTGKIRTITFQPGCHVIELYGIETCCHGRNQVKFHRRPVGEAYDAGQFKIVSGAELNHTPYNLSTQKDLVYDFEISLRDNVEWKEECLDVTVLFGGSAAGSGGNGQVYTGQKNIYQKSENDIQGFNTWQYVTGTPNKFDIKIRHEDLVDMYNCDYNETPTQFIWNCKLNFFFSYFGEPQYEYWFDVQTIIDRATNAQESLTVTPTLVEGQCCENTLNVDMEMKFCTDITCDTEKTDSVERLGDIFVEVYLPQPQFQNLYLYHKGLQIGPFTPEITNWTIPGPGRFIYQTKSNVAAQFTVTSRMTLYLTIPSGVTAGTIYPGEVPDIARRRALQSTDSEFENGDYDVKIQSSLTIVEENSQTGNKSSKSDDESNNETIYLIIIIVLAVVLLLGGAALTIYAKNIKDKYQKTNKYEVQDNAKGSTPQSTRALQQNPDNFAKASQFANQQQQQQQ